MKKTHFFALIAVASGFTATQAGCSAQEPVGASDQTNMPVSSAPVLDISGRYSGRAGSRSAGLILSKNADHSYIAVVIVYTDLLRDNLVENIASRIDRVVERIALYRAVAIGTDEMSYSFEPLTVQNGLASSMASSKDVSVLTISDRGEVLRPVGPFRPGEPQPPHRFSAVLSAAPSGEKTPIIFESFLGGAQQPSSTWDKDFVANTWEDTYLLAKRQAQTLRDDNKEVLDVREPEAFAGQFEMKPVTLKTGSGNQTVHGLYSLSARDSAAPNPLSDRLAIFIDVVNRKPLFNTRELFLIHHKSGESYRDSNKDGFVMYFEKGGLL